MPNGKSDNANPSQDAMVSLNVSKTAALIGVSISTVRRYADSGVLPSYLLPGGTRRFEASEVLAFKEDMRVTVSKDGAK